MTLPINLVVVTLAVVVSLLWAGVRAQRAVHMLQLDSYANRRFLQWLTAQLAGRLIDWPSAISQVLFLAVALVLPTTLVSATALLAAWVVCEAGLLLYAYLHMELPKKPLVYTGRALRILGTSVVISRRWWGPAHGWRSATSSSISQPHSTTEPCLVLLAALLVIQGSPLTTVLANLILSPVQRAINQTYLRRARGRLRDVNPLVIGITGSYGKTSTKYLLEHLAGQPPQRPQDATEL